MIARTWYLQQLKSFMWDGQIKVITGLRRCGKSVLLFNLFCNMLLENGVKAQNIIKIQLDKRRNAKFRNPLKLAEYVETIVEGSKEEYYLLIDEIQYCHEVPDDDNPGYTISVYDLLNELKDYPNLDVYVTGSNSKMLSTDISTEFRGRASEIHVFPLCFSEYHNYRGGDLRENLKQYMTYGGMPYAVKLENDIQRGQYLKRLFHEVYIKDIVERREIEHKALLEDILNLTASATGSLTNPTTVANSIGSLRHTKVNISTVCSYLSHLQDAFLLTEVKRYDIKGKQYLSTPNKYYYSDHGLRNARLNFRQIDAGHIMENILFNELLLRGYSVDVGVVWDRRGGKTAQKEVDFVVNLGDRRCYIQSAFEMQSYEKQQRETESLKLTKDFFKKILVQWELPHNFMDEDGILHCSAADFLLDRTILEM